MTIIFVLIPIAVLLTIIGIYLFFWAVKTDQFNDLEKQGMSILFDDETSPQENNIIIEPIELSQEEAQKTNHDLAEKPNKKTSQKVSQQTIPNADK